MVTAMPADCGSNGFYSGLRCACWRVSRSNERWDWTSGSILRPASLRDRSAPQLHFPLAVLSDCQSSRPDALCCLQPKDDFGVTRPWAWSRPTSRRISERAQDCTVRLLWSWKKSRSSG